MISGTPDIQRRPSKPEEPCASGVRAVRFCWPADDVARPEATGNDQTSRHGVATRLTLERLFDKLTFEPNTGCWLWTGALDLDGYPAIKVGGVRAVAHRVLWELTIARIAPKLDLDHLCRQRSCCNPSHLEPVTHQVNTKRAADARRGGR